MRPTRKERKRESGSALIAVLCLIFTAGLLVTAVVSMSQYNTFTLGTRLALQRSFYTAEGAANRIQWLIAADRIIAIVSPDSAPVKRMIQEARDRKRVIDATQGRRTRAVIQTDSDHVVLSAIQPETIAGRVGQRDAVIRDEEKEV